MTTNVPRGGTTNSACSSAENMDSSEEWHELKPAAQNFEAKKTIISDIFEETIDNDEGLTMHYEFEDFNLVTVSISNLGDHPMKLDDFIQLQPPTPRPCLDSKKYEFINGTPPGKNVNISTPPGKNGVKMDKSRKNPGEKSRMKEYKLPFGWIKLATQRCTGATKGHWDVYLISPKGKRLRSNVELRRYLKCNPGMKYDANLTVIKRPQDIF